MRGDDGAISCPKIIPCFRESPPHVGGHIPHSLSQCVVRARSAQGGERCRAVRRDVGRLEYRGSGGRLQQGDMLVTGGNNSPKPPERLAECRHDEVYLVSNTSRFAKTGSSGAIETEGMCF